MKRSVITFICSALLGSVGFVASPAHATGAGSVDGALRTVSASRVFFGHQSVGWNILDGMERLYASRGVTRPKIVDGAAALPVSGRGFAQQEIGSNGDPRSKFADFAAALGSGRNVRVAAMKLCFVDITAGSDPARIFAAYKRTIATLSTLNPGTRFVHVTVPLTVNDPASNAKRQQYNQMLRREYGSGVFDLAEIESTSPNGSRVTGSYRGHRYFALFAGYASDDGHLNPRGSRRSARGFVQALAAAVS